MKTRYAALLMACICLWVSIASGVSRQADVSRSNAQYVDKLFGIHFIFAPKPDEVMIKFSGGGSSLQKSGIANMLIGVDRNFDFAGVKKIEEIILCQAPHTPFSERQAIIRPPLRFLSAGILANQNLKIKQNV